MSQDITFIRKGGKVIPIKKKKKKSEREKEIRLGAMKVAGATAISVGSAFGHASLLNRASDAFIEHADFQAKRKMVTEDYLKSRFHHKSVLQHSPFDYAKSKRKLDMRKKFFDVTRSDSKKLAKKMFRARGIAKWSGILSGGAAALALGSGVRDLWKDDGKLNEMLGKSSDEVEGMVSSAIGFGTAYLINKYTRVKVRATRKNPFGSAYKNWNKSGADLTRKRRRAAEKQLRKFITNSGPKI